MRLNRQFTYRNLIAAIAIACMSALVSAGFAIADEVAPGDLPRPPQAVKPVVIVPQNGQIYTNIGVPNSILCYIPPFFNQLSPNEQEAILANCNSQKEYARYMEVLTEYCKKRNCVITFTGSGVFRFDVLEPGSPGPGGYATGTPVCDPTTKEGKACEWRQTIINMCKYSRDPSYGIMLPEALKKYIELLRKADPNFEKYLQSTCNNPNCAETVPDFSNWINGQKCEKTPALRLPPSGKPEPLRRCDNCKLVEIFVNNWDIYEEIIKKTPQGKPTRDNPRGAIFGPQPLNPNWNGVIDALGPVLIGAELIYGAGNSAQLIGSGGPFGTPGQTVGQTIATGAQAATGTYMLVGGTGMAVTAIGYGGVGGAMVGAAGPAAIIGLAPIVGYGAGQVTGSLITGGSMEDLLIGAQNIKVPPKEASCSERTSFLAKSQGAFCNSEGRLNNWFNRGCSECCNKAFTWQSGANQDLKACLGQSPSYRGQYISACMSLCGK